MTTTRRQYTQLTITPEQEQYVRANLGKIKRTQICKDLGITKGKLDGNLNIMTGITLKKTKPRVRDTPTNGIFNVNQYACWILGISYNDY